MKILVLGTNDQAIQAFLEGFNLSFQREIFAHGIEIMVLDLNIGGQSVKGQIWKANLVASFTMGSEYLLPADGALIIFNKNKKELDSVTGWIEQIWKKETKEMMPLVFFSHQSSVQTDNASEISKAMIDELALQLSEKTSSSGFIVRNFEFQDQTLANRTTALMYLGQQMIQSSPRSISHFLHEATAARAENKKFKMNSQKVKDKVTEMKEELEEALLSISETDLQDTSEKATQMREELEEWRLEIRQLETEAQELLDKANDKEIEAQQLEKKSKEAKIKYKQAIKEAKAEFKKLKQG